MAEVPSSREQLISQIPALHLLMALGYEYLTPAQPLGLRAGRTRTCSVGRRRQQNVEAWLCTS